MKGDIVFFIRWNNNLLSELTGKTMVEVENEWPRALFTFMKRNQKWLESPSNDKVIEADGIPDKILCKQMNLFFFNYTNL